jgi:hypothetical protein
MKVRIMDEKNKFLTVKVIYWLGVVLDGLFAVDMMIITLFGVKTPLSTIFTLPGITDIGSPYRFALGIAAAMMWGWTFLLFWGVQDPLERKGTLILTSFPVITGLAVSNVFAGLNNVISFTSLILRPIIYLVLFSLFTIAFFLADRLQKSNFKP